MVWGTVCVWWGWWCSGGRGRQGEGRCGGGQGGRWQRKGKWKAAGKVGKTGSGQQKARGCVCAKCGGGR